MPRSLRLRGALAALALLVVLAGALLLRPAALAHEGEDHGEPAGSTPAASADGTITVAQDAQFALGRNDQARDSYQKALTRLDVDAPQRRLLELKLTQVGGTPSKPEART